MWTNHSESLTQREQLKKQGLIGKTDFASHIPFGPDLLAQMQRSTKFTFFFPHTHQYTNVVDRKRVIINKTVMRGPALMNGGS